MDPYVAYRLMMTATEDSIDRGESALALLDWLNRGGFWDHDEVGGVTREEAYEQAEAIARDALVDGL
jgi:hypothetical protein